MKRGSAHSCRVSSLPQPRGLAKMDAIGGAVAPRPVSLGGGRCRTGIFGAFTYDPAERRAGVRSALSGRRPRK